MFQFDRTVATAAELAEPLTVDDLSHRYLWDPAAVDQLMADEQVTDPDVAGDIVWPLGDHQGTIRDLAVYDSSTDTTTVVNHRTFDAYGNLQSQTNAAHDTLFGFTGRPLDQATSLQNNLHRWYDPATGRWMSEDPIGFEGRDGNLSAYVGNGPVNATDPSGLQYGLRPEIGAHMIPAMMHDHPLAVERRRKEAERRLAEYYRNLPSADELEQALLYADLAQGAYVLETNDVCRGWQVIDFEERKDGYRTVLYRRRGEDGTFEYIRAFAGTDQKRDWITSFLQGRGYPSPQYIRAEAVAKLDLVSYGTDNLHFIGHSLGGGLASTAAIVTGVGATTFNAAGVHEFMSIRYPDNWAAQRKLITAYRVVGEALTSLQDSFFPVGWFMPNTIGRVISLNFETIPRSVSRSQELHPPRLRPDAGAIARHGMDAVKQSLQHAYDHVRSAR